MRSIRRARRPLVALVVLVLALVVGYLVRAAESHHQPSHVHGTVALSALPEQARQTVRLIRAGGPFPYPDHDGVVFHDYGNVLPAEPAGWYHEYTVPTPGSTTRGPRRLITGRDGGLWYTADHYESFERVDVDR